MFSVMRLKEDEQVTVVFDDGVKRLWLEVLDSESQQSLEILEELADNTELPGSSDHCFRFSQRR